MVCGGQKISLLLIGQLKNPMWFLTDNKENLDASGLYASVLIGLFFWGGGGGRKKPPTRAFLGELVFHPSPQTPAKLRTTFFSQA